MKTQRAKLVILFLTIFVFLFIPRAFAFQGDLIITEVLPNPIGTDSEGEYIEIYNDSNNTINITNLLIDGKKINPYQDEFVADLEPEQFIIIHDDNFDIKETFPGDYSRGVLSSTFLSNTGDTVVISDLNNKIYDEFSYLQSTEGIPIVRPTTRCTTTVDSFDGNSSLNVLEDIDNYDHSIFEFEDCFFLETQINNTWTTELKIENTTSIPFRANYLEDVFILDEIIWVVDGDEYIGEEIIILSSPNSVHEIEINIRYNADLTYTYPMFTIENKEIETDNPIDTPVTNSKTIRINEILANPTLGDEWIELFNYGSEEVDLNGWSIKDASSTSYKSLPQDKIQPLSFLILEGTTLNVSLNNTGDTISIYSPDLELIDKINYQNTDKDISWSLFDDGFKTTSTITKSAVNVLSTTSTTTQESTSSDSSSGNSSSSSGSSSGNQSTESLLAKLPIKNVRLLPEKSRVHVEGIVTVDQNILGENIFYIQDESSGIKVKLKTGLLANPIKENQKLDIIGELRKSVEELYIYVDSLEELKIDSTNNNYSATKLENTSGLEIFEGILVEFEGIIESISGTSFNVLSSGNNYKVSILKSTEIDSIDKSKGDKVKITGIVSQYKTATTQGDGYRILPRRITDIVIQSNAEVKNLESPTIDETELSYTSPKLISNSAYIPSVNVSDSTTSSLNKLNSTVNANSATFTPIANYVDNSDDQVSSIDSSNSSSGESEDIANSPNRSNKITYSSLALVSLLGLWEIPTTKKLVEQIIIWGKKIKFDL